MGHRQYDDVIKWKHFPRYWPPVKSLHKGQWHGGLIFSLICAWINAWVNKSWRWWLETPSRPLWSHCNEKSKQAVWKIHLDPQLAISKLGCGTLGISAMCMIWTSHYFHRNHWDLITHPCPNFANLFPEEEIGLEALGAITVSPRFPRYPQSISYFRSLRPESNQRDPFFITFWERHFQCILANSTTAEGNLCDQTLSLDDFTGFYEVRTYLSCDSPNLVIPCDDHSFNTLRPRQIGRHFPDDIFKWVFLNKNVGISINISLKFVPRGPINNIPTLVQVMAWHRSDDKPLSEPMMVRLEHG